MDATELILLYDYYGELLTDRQRECFELRYYQDLSLGEIGQEIAVVIIQQDQFCGLHECLLSRVLA